MKTLRRVLVPTGLQWHPVLWTQMLPALLRRALALQAILVLACFLTEAVCFFLLGLRYPYDCPVMVYKGDYFPDFTLLIQRLFVHMHTLAFFAPGNRHFMYPPAATLLYEPFALLPSRQIFAFVTVLFLTIAAMATLFARGLIRRGAAVKQAFVCVVAGVLLSYPIWFDVQRGNTEIFIWAITAAGVWALYRDRPYLAATCFGTVAAMKLYPVLFFGLLLARRQYRQLAFGVFVALTLTLACLWLEYPDISLSLHETVYGLRNFQFSYVQGRFLDVISYDHSLLSLFKRIFVRDAAQMALASRLYVRLIALGGVLLYFLRIRKQPFVNQVLALTVAMILLPPVSFDYTLLHLYTPLCLLTVTVWHTEPFRGVRLAVPMLALLLSPLTEFIYAGHSLEGQLKAVLLLGLFVIALVYPMDASEAPVRGSLNGGVPPKTGHNRWSRARVPNLFVSAQAGEGT